MSHSHNHSCSPQVPLRRNKNLTGIPVYEHNNFLLSYQLITYKNNYNKIKCRPKQKNCGQRLELLNVTSPATNPRDLSSHRHRALPLRYLEPHRHTNIGAQFNCKSYTNSHPFRQTNILTFRQPRQYFKT